MEIKACDYAHAMKQLKAWAKRDGFEIVGNKKGYENQVNGQRGIREDKRDHHGSVEQCERENRGGKE